MEEKIKSALYQRNAEAVSIRAFLIKSSLLPNKKR